MELGNRKCKEENTISETEEDRISKLPDPLIHKVLSFLDIKQVARTSVLSKRWGHIWTSVPTLDLLFWVQYVPSPLLDLDKFMDFVHRTLFLHDASSIQKFALSLYSDMNASRVHSWISHLTRRCNVEEIRLHADWEQDIPLSIPLSLLTCESLTKLHLTLCPTMHFPKNMFLPKLKSLHLSCVQFGEDGCRNEEPFSSCPVLEELFLVECSWDGMTKFCVFTPVLRVLKIDNVFDLEEEHALENCDLKIHAPSLVSLSFQGNLAKDYDMSSFLALDKAEGVFFSYKEESRSEAERISHAVGRFLRALSHVRCLSIYIRTAQVSVPYDFVDNLPTFHKLDELELLRGAATDKILFALLKAAPNVKWLDFSEFDNQSCDDERENDETEDMFRHLQIVRHLQFVRFWQFKGEASELRWAKLILKNAESLERMTITYTPLYSHAKNKEVVTSELECLPRASARCVVKVK